MSKGKRLARCLLSLGCERWPEHVTLTQNGREAVGGPLVFILSFGSDRACIYAYSRRARTYDMLPDAGCLSGEDIGTFWPVNEWVGIIPATRHHIQLLTFITCQTRLQR